MKRWRWMFRLALAVLAPVLLLASAEGILRLVSPGWPTAFFVRAETGAWVENPFFGLRFFPPALVRTPAPSVIPAQKPPGAVRVVVLGESAAMGEPAPAYGMSRFLQAFLAARHPSRSFEVVNAAMTAINSTVIREIAGDALRLEPDLFILYMGNNEVIGPYGPGTVLNVPGASSWLTRARVLFTRTRLFQALKKAFPMAAGGAQESWAGLEMFQRTLPAGDPRLAGVYAQFRQNLAAILRTAQAQDVRVLLCTVAVNLRDCAPFASEPPSGMDPDTNGWWKAYQQGLASAKAGQWTEAVAFYQQAALHAPGHAETLWRLGQAFEQAGKAEPARSAYSRARDLDTLRFRADSKLNDLIRAEAQSSGARLLDLEAALADQSHLGVPGKEFFLDHVHFTFAGHYQAALFLTMAVEQALGLTPEPAGKMLSPKEMAEALLYTPWSEADILTTLLDRHARPPFIQQAENEKTLAEWREQRAGLLAAQAQYPLAALRKTAEAAMAKHSADPYFPAEWGQVLLELERYPEAARVLREACARAPQNFDLRGLLALAEAFLGRPAEGVRIIVGDEKRENPLARQVLLQTARRLSLQARYPEAQVFLRSLLQQDPSSADAVMELAHSLLRTRQPELAEQALREAIPHSRKKAPLYEELGVLMTLQQRWEEADAAFAQAQAVAPQRTTWQVKQAVSWIVRGDASKGEEMLRAVVAREPGNGEAWYQLGVYRAKLDRWEEAAQCFEQARRADPVKEVYGEALQQMRERQRLISGPDR